MKCSKGQKSRKSLKTSLVFIIIFISGSFSIATGEKYTGVISGQVMHALTGEPLPGATIRILGQDIGTASSADGNYIIKNVPVGIYALQASLIGFSSAVKNDIVVDPISPIRVDFKLYENAIQLEKVVVKPSYFARLPEYKTSTQIQTNEEIRKLPGGFGDVVRAVSILPGVAQVQAGRNDLIIRGGAPSENLYVVDGFEIQNINHFGTQGSSGGPLSYINLDYIDQTSFSTGGFGVKYGDKLSSVLNIDLKDGRQDGLGGKGTISATQFGLDLEGPVGDDGSFILTARRSYLDFIFKAAGFGFVPEYWDFLGKVEYRIDPANRINILALGAIDNTRFFNETQDQRYDNSRILGSDQKQAVAGISWQRLVGNGIATLSLAHYDVDFFYRQSDSLLTPIFESSSTESETYLRSDYIRQLARSTELAIGLQGKMIGFDNDIYLRPETTSYGDIITLDKNYEGRAFKGSQYIQLTQNFRGFSLTAGMRTDYFDMIEKKLSLAPRFAGTFYLTEKLNINAGLGRYYQAPSYIWLAANTLNRNLRHIGVDQAIAGIEYFPGSDIKMSLEGYVKRYFDYPVSIDRPYLIMSNTGAGFGGTEDGFSSFGIDRLVSRGAGLAKGIELFVQKKLSEIPCYGLVSLSLSETRFKALDGVSRPGSFDQRLILNAGGGYLFNSSIEIATRFRLSTGRPYTPFNPDGSRDSDLYNGARVKTNHSLDLRIDKRWMFSNWMMIVFIDIQNIYNNKPDDIPRYDERTSSIIGNDSIGILPSIGLTVGF